jgi:hypothetical protein
MSIILIIICVLLLVIAIGILLLSETGRDILGTGANLFTKAVLGIVCLGLLSGVGAMWFFMTDGGVNNVILWSLYLVGSFFALFIYLYKDFRKESGWTERELDNTNNKVDADTQKKSEWEKHKIPVAVLAVLIILSFASAIFYGLQ